MEIKLSPASTQRLIDLIAQEISILQSIYRTEHHLLTEEKQRVMDNIVEFQEILAQIDVRGDKPNQLSSDMYNPKKQAPGSVFNIGPR